MIKFLQFTFSIFFCLAFLPLNSQITIEQEDYLFLTDFVDTVYWAQSQTIEAPSEGPDQFWDYGNLSHTNTSYTELKSADGNPHYPDAFGYWESNFTFSGLIAPVIQYYAIDEDGSQYQPGVFYQDTTHSINPISGGSRDELTFPERFDLFEGRVNLLEFPLEYTNMWEGSRKEVTDFNVTVEAFGMAQAPGNRTRFLSEEREITGWGEVVIPNAEGEPGHPIEVLQVKVIQNMVDSFFVGGSPAPPNLLNPFGLTQGSETTYTFYLFFTKGFHNNVLRVNLGSSGEVFSASYRPSANDLISNTFDIATANDFKLYPNPARTGSSVTIETGDQFTEGYIRIVDISGRQVHRSAIDNQTGQIQLDLPAHLISGNYFYHIFNHSGTFIGTGKMNIMD